MELVAVEWSKIKAALAVWWYRPRRWWWFLWSHAYRALFQHSKYKDITLPYYSDPYQLQEVLDKVEWTGDGVREMGDACGMPEFFHHCLKQVLLAGSQPPSAKLDCDDFAGYGQRTLVDRFKPTILCVMWVDVRTDEVKGHAVLVGQYPSDYQDSSGMYFHQGNWGLYGPFMSLEAVVRHIEKYGHSIQRLAWAVLEPNLKPRHIGYGTVPPDLTL